MLACPHGQANPGKLPGEGAGHCSTYKTPGSDGPGLTALDGRLTALVRNGPEMLWGGDTGLLTGPALVRGAGLVSCREENFPEIMYLKCSAGRPGGANGRSSPSGRGGRLSVPRAPSYPVVVAFRDSLRGVYFCHWLRSRVSLCSLIH